MVPRAEYDITTDDLVDCNLRALRRTPLWRRSRIQQALLGAVITAAAAYGFSLLYGTSSFGWLTSLPVGFVAGAVLSWRSHPRRIKKSITRIVTEQMTSDDPIPFTIELREDCIWYQQGQLEVKTAWSSLVQVVDSTGPVEMLLENAAWIAVQDRGFGSTEHRAEFIRVARDRIES